MTARLLDMSTADYYADKVEDVPTLSYSTAATMITQSPLHAQLEHPRLGGRPREATPAMATGTIIHALLLEENPGTVIQPVPFDDFRKKESREARDQILAAGMVPVTVERFSELTIAADTIRSRLADLGVKLNGKREVSVAWTEGKVKCRGRLDHLVLEKGQIDELKTTSSAHPDAITRRITERGYDVQHAAYTSAVEKLLPAMQGRVRFRFLFCETEPPYAVTPVEFSGVFREYGERRWMRAVRTWETCLREGRWPGYGNQVLEPIPWVFEREMGEFDATS